MTTKRASKRRKLAAKPEKGNMATNVKSKVKAETTTPRATVKESARLKSHQLLPKSQKGLRSAPGKIEHKRQAQNTAHKVLTKAPKNLVTGRLNVAQEHHAQISRVSFVVRLTLDENGQFGRTEIEYVSSSRNRKQNFLSLDLDGDHLVAFMKECISSLNIPKSAMPVVRTPEKVKDLTPIQQRPKFSLVVSDIQLFNSRAPNIMNLTVMSGEPLIVQARFQLQGLEARSFTAQEPFYEMKVYINEITSSTPKLLTTYRAKLIQNVLEYTVPTEVSGLSHGLYRLFTVVTLGADIKMASHYDGPMVQVI